MSDDRQEKLLQTIRKLLDKAAGTQFPEEAETFRAKADELMTKYAIEMWQIDKARVGSDAVSSRKPIRKDMDISWWYTYKTPYEVRSAMWGIFHEVAVHCRCVVVARHSDYKRETVPVVGLEQDIAYLDMLFTHLLVQLADAMDPRPKPGEPLIEALVRMKEAGLKWEECHRRLRAAGLVPDEPWSKKVASKMNFAGKYTRYCQEHGKERTYTSPAIYQRSFTDGFEWSLRERLRKMRDDQGQSTGSMAVVLHDIRGIVRSAMWDMFEDMRPHPDDCECDQCHECDDPDCERPRCKAKRDKRKPVKAREVRMDWGVVARGSKAAQEVQIISDTPTVGNRGGRELGG